MEKTKYILESSPNKKDWTHRATFLEGKQSRFGLPFDANVAVMEAKSFIDHWTHRNGPRYDTEVLTAIHDRKYVRIIIEL